MKSFSFSSTAHTSILASISFAVTLLLLATTTGTLATKHIAAFIEDIGYRVQAKAI